MFRIWMKKFFMSILFALVFMALSAVVYFCFVFSSLVPLPWGIILFSLPFLGLLLVTSYSEAKVEYRRKKDDI